MMHEGNIITPAVFYPGYAIDVMNAKPDLDFGEFAVYPIEAAHSFYGYPRNAEVPPTKKKRRKRRRRRSTAYKRPKKCIEF